MREQAASSVKPRVQTKEEDRDVARFSVTGRRRWTSQWSGIFGALRQSRGGTNTCKERKGDSSNKSIERIRHKTHGTRKDINRKRKEHTERKD